MNQSIETQKRQVTVFCDIPQPLGLTTKVCSRQATVTLKLGMALNHTTSHYVRCGNQLDDSDSPSTARCEIRNSDPRQMLYSLDHLQSNGEN